MTDNDMKLAQIADDLWANWADFEDSKADAMDEMLGEIYRAKLDCVFKILKRHGIDPSKSWMNEVR